MTDDFGDLKKLIKTQNYPVENMCLRRYGNSSIRIGLASMQGFRNNMEDFNIVELNLSQHPNIGLFGILDGHNGTDAARWFSENLCKAVDNIPTFTTDSIKQTLIALDEEYLKVTGNKTSGTTATFCLIEKIDDIPDKSHKVTICHIGDSRLYIGKYSSTEYVLTTEDHKPTIAAEKKRIIAAGGHVIMNRVDSMLAVSRALGDHFYKSNKELPATSQKVIAIPDVSISYVGKEDYLFLCCDGVLEPRFVKQGLGIFQYIVDRFDCSSLDSAQILSDLIRHLLQNGARDNMTAMIIEFKNGEDYNTGIEFIAGEYYEYGNPSYMNAFRSSCEQNGKTIEEVRSLWDTQKKVDEEPTDLNPETPHIQKNE